MLKAGVFKFSSDEYGFCESEWGEVGGVREEEGGP